MGHLADAFDNLPGYVDSLEAPPKKMVYLHSGAHDYQIGDPWTLLHSTSVCTLRAPPGATLATPMKCSPRYQRRAGLRASEYRWSPAEIWPPSIGPTVIRFTISCHPCFRVVPFEIP